MAKNGNGKGGFLANIIGPAVFGFGGSALVEVLDVPYLNDQASFPVAGPGGINNFQTYSTLSAFVLSALGLLSWVSKKPILGFDRNALIQGAALGASIGVYSGWGRDTLNIGPQQ